MALVVDSNAQAPLTVTTGEHTITTDSNHWNINVYGTKADNPTITVESGVKLNAVGTSNVMRILVAGEGAGSSYGETGTLNINGGHVTATHNTTPVFLGTGGTININSGGSLTNKDNFYGGGQINVDNGSVSTKYSRIGSLPGGSAELLNGSTWTTDLLHLQYNSAMTVDNSTAMVSGKTIVGRGGGSDGTLNVTNNGSLVAATLHVGDADGYSSSGGGMAKGTLNITNGGKVESGVTKIGVSLGQALVNVEDGGTFSTGTFSMSDLSRMNVKGGTVESTSASVGGTGRDGKTVSVTDGGKWTVSDNMSIGSIYGSNVAQTAVEIGSGSSVSAKTITVNRSGGIESAGTITGDVNVVGGVFSAMGTKVFGDLTVTDYSFASYGTLELLCAADEALFVDGLFTFGDRSSLLLTAEESWLDRLYEDSFHSLINAEAYDGLDRFVGQSAFFSNIDDLGDWSATYGFSDELGTFGIFLSNTENVVPEPGTLAIFALFGLGGIGWRTLRNRKR